MNYVERHLGDHAKQTAHLTMLELGAYTLLMDRYYSTEAAIPASQVYRVTRCRTPAERAAVDAVLQEFFTLEADQWRSAEAEQNIANAQKRINAAKANGAKGGRPKKNPEETQRVSSGLNQLTQSKAHQSPITNHQAPDTSEIPSAPVGAGAAAPPPSPADVIFALGVPLLMASAVPERNARSMLGLMRKTHGDEAVIGALQRCAAEKPLQPVPWLQAALKAPAATKPDRIAQANIAVVRKFHERTAQ